MQKLKEEICAQALSLFQRGYASGGAGNISALFEDLLIITPTNSSLGALSPDELSICSLSGSHIEGKKPSKELFLHLAFYESRPKAKAIVHLHSPYLTALSCLDELDSKDTLPALTPYFVMRVGKLPLVPYFAPGKNTQEELIKELAKSHNSVLLAKHGPVVSAANLVAASFNAQELEDTARLFFILQGQKASPLGPDQIKELNELYPKA